MTTSAPSVSVILPVKNGSAYIEAAIVSILTQTFSDFELLIIDDSSSDDTMDIARRVCGADPRARILVNPGAGLVEALNVAIGAARARLIARMDADDIALPQRLERQHAFMAAHPEVAVVGSQARFIDQRGALTGKATGLPESHEAIAKTLLRYCCLNHPTVLMRADALKRVGGYRAIVPVAEDLDLWLRIAEHGRLANLAESLLLYRAHAGQVSQSKAWTQRLSRNLAIISARERRAGRPDPLTTYACFSATSGRPECRGKGCAKSICDSLHAFRAAEALLEGERRTVSESDARLLLRYLSNNAIGDGKNAHLRVLIALCHEAANRRDALLWLHALGLAIRVHPGRSLRLLRARRQPLEDYDRHRNRPSTPQG
jgi:GT2 family glycosyltransferase